MLQNEYEYLTYEYLFISVKNIIDKGYQLFTQFIEICKKNLIILI